MIIYNRQKCRLKVKSWRFSNFLCAYTSSLLKNFFSRNWIKQKWSIFCNLIWRPKYNPHQKKIVDNKKENNKKRWRFRIIEIFHLRTSNNFKKQRFFSLSFIGSRKNCLISLTLSFLMLKCLMLMKLSIKRYVSLGSAGSLVWRWVFFSSFKNNTLNIQDGLFTLD